MSHVLRALGALVLSVASWASHAQALDLNGLMSGAARVLQAIDGGQAAGLWEGASTAVRPAVTAQAFAMGVAQQRQPLGNPSERQWVQINRMVVGAGAQTPPGNYISIEFVSAFSAGRTVRELVSLRLDEDQIWRLSGYSVR